MREVLCEACLGYKTLDGEAQLGGKSYRLRDQNIWNLSPLVLTMRPGTVGRPFYVCHVEMTIPSSDHSRSPLSQVGLGRQTIEKSLSGGNEDNTVKDLDRSWRWRSHLLQWQGHRRGWRGGGAGRLRVPCAKKFTFYSK